MNALNRFTDPVYCVMRLIVGLTFASHGGQLVLGMFGGMKGSDSMLLQVAGWIQLVGGFMIALGLFTRLAAFIASGHMAVAYFMAHAPQGFFPIATKGELAVFYCWVFFFMVFYGSGRWSLDALLFKKGAATPGAAT
jgi:putative oxidoreductase